MVTLGKAVTGAEARKAIASVKAYRECFAFGPDELKSYKGDPVRIVLSDERPIFRRQYRLAPVEKEAVQKKCMELWEAELIEKSTGPWAAATVAPRKKDVLGRWTEHLMCGDYRPVNTKTPFDVYPMPLPKEIFHAVGKSTVFSTLDLRSGYHQLPLAPEDRPKTAFWGIDKDGQERLYQWKVLPFGLKNARLNSRRLWIRPWLD